MNTQTTEQMTGHPDELNKSGGHTVDDQGLLNNYAIEPEMYEQDGGELSATSSKVTVVDIFTSVLEAETAVLTMEQKGLHTDQIAIIGKDYCQQPQNSMNWEHITASGGLAVVLSELGIGDQATVQFVEAIAQDKFLVIAIGSDREASQAQLVLEEIGHTRL